jgi:hypothetical protein
MQQNENKRIHEFSPPFCAWWHKPSIQDTFRGYLLFALERLRKLDTITISLQPFALPFISLQTIQKILYRALR